MADPIVPCKRGHFSPRYPSNGGCIECHKTKGRENYLKNREKYIARSKVWAEQNRERSREIKRGWREQNPEKQRESERNWRAANPDYDYNRWRESGEYREINRKAKKRHRGKYPARDKMYQLGPNVPAWADHDEINKHYLLRDKLNIWTGTRYVVDHIIPLNGKKVSGLHVDNNLQVITDRENRKKWNHFSI